MEIFEGTSGKAGIWLQKLRTDLNQITGPMIPEARH